MTHASKLIEQLREIEEDPNTPPEYRERARQKRKEKEAEQEDGEDAEA